MGRQLGVAGADQMDIERLEDELRAPVDGADGRAGVAAGGRRLDRGVTARAEVRWRGMDLRTEFGDIDIYVFDQLLRGRIAPGMRVLDAGCGGDRNLVYLSRQGYTVFGNDDSPEAIAKVQDLAATLAPGRTADLRHEVIEDTSFEDASADVVVASVVLHGGPCGAC